MGTSPMCTRLASIEMLRGRVGTGGGKGMPPAWPSQMRGCLELSCSIYMLTKELHAEGGSSGHILSGTAMSIGFSTALLAGILALGCTQSPSFLAFVSCFLHTAAGTGLGPDAAVRRPMLTPAAAWACVSPCDYVGAVSLHVLPAAGHGEHDVRLFPHVVGSTETD